MKARNLSLIFFSVILAACDGKNSVYSPTSPTAVSSGVGSSSDRNSSSRLNDTCGNPNDWEPDDSELQACLDRGGNIYLTPGEPGYIVNRGLEITRHRTVITSSGSGARIVASRDLFATILKTRGSVDGIEITNISVDGMVDEMAEDGPYRRRRDGCKDGNAPGNISITGNDFKFIDNVSRKALCGSGLGIYGKRHEIRNNLIESNGRDRYAGAGGDPWADGITALFCEGGNIIGNTLIDNTDISLALGGGYGCRAEGNKIINSEKYVFSGINIGNFLGGDGDHTGSLYINNTVSSGPNKMAMGISAGSHMWRSDVDVRHAGKVSFNTVSGANINLVVDGVYGGEITENNIYDPHYGVPEGEVCGRYGANYTVYPPHAKDVTLQSGWIPFQYDGDVCDPPLIYKPRTPR